MIIKTLMLELVDIKEGFIYQDVFVNGNYIGELKTKDKTKKREVNINYPKNKESNDDNSKDNINITVNINEDVAQEIDIKEIANKLRDKIKQEKLR